MTQGGPHPASDHHFMSGGLPAMGDYGSFNPVEQVFRDPVYSDARRSRQMDRDDLPQRMSNMDLGDDASPQRRPSLARRRSASRRSSLKRTSTSSGIPVAVNYELWRFQKVGDDWTKAVRDVIAAPQKELAKKAKSGKSKSGKALEQMETMVQTRRGQVNDLLETKYNQTGFGWEPAYIEEVKAGINRLSGKKDVRVFDVIVARAGLTGSSRPLLSRARTASVSIPRGELVRLSRDTDRGRDRDRDLEDYGSDVYDRKDKDRDGSFGRKGWKKDVKDPDPHGLQKLFHSNGKPLDLNTGGAVKFDEFDLPPHITDEQPIGRRLDRDDEPLGRKSSLKKKGAKKGKNQHKDSHDDIHVLDDDGAFADGGAAEVLDDMMDFDNILPKGKSKKGKSKSRSQSRAATGGNRSRSKSKTRFRAHAEHREKRGERVDNYLDGGHSARSSDHGSGNSVFMMGDEDDTSFTSFTSSGIHHDMAEPRGSIHRRNSSKHHDLPFREHYRGPDKGRNGRYYGEQIMIPARPIRRLSMPMPLPMPQKAIGYGDYLSGGGGHISPVDHYGRNLSPRQRYGIPEVLYPHELLQDDQRSERLVEGYMQEDRLYDFKQRELDERERALERKERHLRRLSVQQQGSRYAAPGYYN